MADFLAPQQDFLAPLDRSKHFDEHGEQKIPDDLIWRPEGGLYPDGKPYRCLWPSANDDEDPDWHRMFYTDSEDESEPVVMITQEVPFRKREWVKPRRRKGEAFCDVMYKMAPALIPEDMTDGLPNYFNAARRLEEGYKARGGGAAAAARAPEAAALKCLEIFRKVAARDTSGVSEEVVWLSCVLYTTAYVDDVRVPKPAGGAAAAAAAAPDLSVPGATLDQE